jgi:hypothetical protein
MSRGRLKYPPQAYPALSVNWQTSTFLNQIPMPTQQRLRLENQDQSLKMGFLGMPTTDNVFHQGYQNQLLAVAD